MWVWVLGGASGTVQRAWLASHLLTFLGKKVRSRPWSQRRRVGDRRQLFGRRGYTRHFLGLLGAGAEGCGGGGGEGNLGMSATGIFKIAFLPPAAAKWLSGFL